MFLGIIQYLQYLHFTAYVRFQRTFATKNVTELRHGEARIMCKFILEMDPKYRLTLAAEDELNPNEYLSRTTIQVRLIMRDTEKLPQDKIRSRQCPPVIQNSFVYFLSTSAKNKAAIIVYVKYDHDEDYSVPEAFVDHRNNISIEKSSSSLSARLISSIRP